MTDDEPTATASTSADASNDETLITITITYKSKLSTFHLSPTATLTDLSNLIATRLSIPPLNQKLIIPTHGLLKPPFTESSTTLPTLSALQSKKITLMGSTTAAVTAIQHTAQVANLRQQNRAAALTHPPSGGSTRPRNNFTPLSPSQQYTFHSIQPLPHLPTPSTSLAYLTRLANDPAIKHIMTTHHFTVSILTEMDPLAHTSVSRDESSISRTLGLNRNKGQSIELRLRTDAGDGYRDYKTVRRTLCHELTHNVHTEHDADFWQLCRRLEREVEDFERGEMRMGDFEREVGPVRDGEGEEVDDHGGWTGGAFVLGGGGGGGGTGGSGGTVRELLAKAAEERLRRNRPDGEGEGGG